MTIAAILEFFKLILEKLSFKNVLIFIGICVIGFGLYKGGTTLYGWGESHQAKTDKAQIVDLTTKLDTANKSLSNLQTAVATWKKTADQEQQDLANLQKEINAKISEGVNKANKNAAYWKKLAQDKKEVIKYVTLKDDARCVIPNGFVELFNQSAQSDTATNSNTNAISGSPSSTLGDPSGVSLSDVTRAVIINNATAVQLRQEVLAWQSWYGTWQKWYDSVYLNNQKIVPH